MEKYLENNDDFKALKDFLLDIECLDPLNEWTNKFNMFDILKIGRTEIRHSNMLAWLMDPRENHGFGEGVIKGFIQYYVSAFSNDEDVFSTLLMDFGEFVIYREWKNIDLLAVSEKDKYVLCIENKVGSKEHSNQLARYRKIVEDAYPGYKKNYIFLSPDGMEASDPENWCTMSYQEVLDIITNEKKRVRLLPDAELLINNYIETIRRDVVGDERLAQICADIYKKHQKALDLIFDNKPDKTSELTAIFVNWAKEKTAAGELQLCADSCAKTYTRFLTSGMTNIMPDSEDADSGWNTKNHYFYELTNNGEKYYIAMYFSSKNMTDEQRDIAEKVNSIYPSRTQKKNWQWRMHFKSKVHNVPEELDEDKIYKKLDDMLQEAKAFEAELVNKLSI